MSTRAVIARKTDTGFTGVYHHWDGYPSGLGATLFELRQEQFQGDTAAMLKVLIDEHPAGWSTINGADWSKPIGWGSRDPGDAQTPGPDCYCHGGRKESGNKITERNASGCGCEWAYVFDGKGKMEVQASYTGPDKMIGMFGCGDENAVWKVVAVVDLDGKEPDWKRLDKGFAVAAAA